MSKQKQKTPRSQLSKKLLIQYFLTLLIYVSVLIVFVFLAKAYCDSHTWYGYEPLYWQLRFIKDNILAFVTLVALAGWSVITYLFISKPLHYLDEVLEISKQLAAPTSEPIVLSPAMVSTENELNLVREKALNDAKAAKEAEQRKNDLVVYLAHDLKTPLTSVIGYLTLLHDEPQISDGLREKYLSIALNKAERLEDLINEFFEITRFNLSNISLEYSKINLTRMLEQTVYEFQPILAEKELRCNLNTPSNVTLICDADKIQRVFDNLLRNSVNYSYAQSTIVINVTCKENQLEIQFKNQGATIPADKLNRIFEQFFRLDTSRATASGGSGLGLAISKQIIEFHHGTIKAESADEWIEFTVTLPLS